MPVYAIAMWLGENPDMQRASTILVHTRNADGAMRMVEELRRCGRNADYVPFLILRGTNPKLLGKVELLRQADTANEILET